MDATSRVWLLCLVAGKQFPNLSVLGVYSSDGDLLTALASLPRDNDYNLYQVPLNQFVGFWHKDGRLLDGMGRLRHHHLLARDTAARESVPSGWDMVEAWLKDGQIP